MIERQIVRLHACEPIDLEQKAPDGTLSLGRVAHRLDDKNVAGLDAALEGVIDAIERIGRRHPTGLQYRALKIAAAAPLPFHVVQNAILPPDGSAREHAR